MYNIIRRNAPVFIIGGILVIIFLAIISYSQRSDTPIIPSLVRLTQDEEISLDFESNPEEEAPITQTPTTTNPSVDPRLIILNHEEADELYGTLEITYTKENGFSPMHTSGVRGQLIRWLNESNESITLKQLSTTSKVWGEQELTILPEATLEFRLDEPLTWSYYEIDSKKAGSIFVRNLFN